MKKILILVLTVMVAPAFGVVIRSSTGENGCEFMSACMLRTEKTREKLFKRLMTKDKDVQDLLYQGYRLKETTRIPQFSENSLCAAAEGNPFFSSPAVFVLCPTEKVEHNK